MHVWRMMLCAEASRYRPSKSHRKYYENFGCGTEGMAMARVTGPGSSGYEPLAVSGFSAARSVRKRQNRSASRCSGLAER